MIKIVCISNVGNKYIVAEETAFGTTPSPFTSVDWGHIQSISINEEENVEKMSSLNSGHLSALFEDGLYWVNLSIETRVSKASLPNLLKFCMGSYSDDGTDYTITTTNASNSVSLKVNYYNSGGTDKVGLINGMVCKDFEISAAKDETVSVTINCLAKKLSQADESLSVTTNTDTPFSWLDTSVTVGGNAYVLESFSLSGNWNVTDNEGRGIESVGAGDRRLIQCVLQHRLDLSGSYEAGVDTNQEFGYTEDRSDEAIVVTLSRGTDNDHVFTMSNTRSFGRDYEHNIENSKKVVSYDYEALDVGVTGDL